MRQMLNKNTNRESRWRTLLYAYLSMLAFSLVFQVIPPIFGFIIPALNISHAQAGALMSFFALPGIFLSIPAGVLTDRFGPKGVSLAALAVALVGSLLVSLGSDFPPLAAGRLISGTGAITLSIVAPQIISRWFVKEDLGIAMGIFNTAMPLGTIFAFNVFGRVAFASNWRLPVILTSAYCLAALLLFYFRYPGLPPGEVAPKAKNTASPASKKPSTWKTGGAVWLVAFIWMMYNAAAISYLTFAGDYYIKAGYAPGYAGFLTSLFMIGSLLCSPLVGYLTDRVGREEYFILGGSMVLAVLMLLVPRTGLNPLLLGILIGVTAGFIPSPVFSLVPKILPSRQAGLGYGILSTFLNIGVLVGPLLIGLSYDRTLSYQPGFNLMAVFALAVAAIVVPLLFFSRLKPTKV